MNIFKKNRYAHDSTTMMFYALLTTIFLLPFSGDGATYALLVGWFFYLFKVRFCGWHWEKTAIDLPICIFVITVFLSILNSPEKMFSFYNAYHLIGKYLLIYYLSIQTISTQKQLQTVFVVLAVSALITVIYGFIQYVVGINTIGMNWTDMHTFPEMKMRIFSTWENPNLFAGYLNIIMALVFGIFIFAKGKKEKIFSASFLILSVIGLILTYARGGCLSIVLAIALYGVFYKQKIILPLVVLLALVLYFDTSLFTRMASIFTTMDTSSELRLALWESTVEMIIDHPLLGIGWGAYYFVYPVYDFYMQGNFIKIVHAHNMYLNMAAEIGIIGFFAFMTCIIRSLYRSLKSYKHMTSNFLSAAMLGCGLALIAILINGFTDFVLFNTRLSMIFWLIMALISIMSKGEFIQVRIDVSNDGHVGLLSLPQLSEEEVRKNKAHNL